MKTPVWYTDQKNVMAFYFIKPAVQQLHVCVHACMHVVCVDLIGWMLWEWHCPVAGGAADTNAPKATLICQRHIQMVDVKNNPFFHFGCSDTELSQQPSQPFKQRMWVLPRIGRRETGENIFCWALKKSTALCSEYRDIDCQSERSLSLSPPLLILDSVSFPVYLELLLISCIQLLFNNICR